jgi:hypothetical protein
MTAKKLDYKLKDIVVDDRLYGHPLAPGGFETLHSEWERVQDVIDGRFANNARRGRRNFAFSGLISCNQCCAPQERRNHLRRVHDCAAERKRPFHRHRSDHARCE